MDVNDALELCRQLDPHTIIPVHYDGWSHFAEGRTDIERVLSKRTDAIADRLQWAPIGRPVELVV